jgi:fermentation-respiration switch protein FrsA (DUF1100 family)
VFAAAVVVLWFVQERLVFVPPPTPVVQGRGATRIDFTSTDGQPLFGLLVRDSTSRSPEVPDQLILHFHGNGDLADAWVDWAREVAARTGWSVLLAEYRGYGGLPGRPTYEGVMRDARAALALVQARYDLAPGEVVLYGHSLGAGVATQLAVEQGARAVLLEAPITSVVDVGRLALGPPLSWLLPLISRIDLAPVDDVRTIDAPVWVVCGGDDEVAPAWMGRSVFNAALRKGKFLLVPEARHGNVAERGGDQYWQWLGQALGLSQPDLRIL